jgi:hypothetical protein
MHLIVIPQEDIKAMVLGHTGGSASPATPLAEAARGIPNLLQSRRDGDFSSAQGCATAIGPTFYSGTGQRPGCFDHFEIASISRFRALFSMSRPSTRVLFQLTIRSSVGSTTIARLPPWPKHP